MFQTRFLPNPIAEYASRTSIPPEFVGLISADRSAIIGRDGWCFVYEGTNNYRNGYLDASCRPIGEDWSVVVESRQTAALQLGIKFLQVIIPNKLTLLQDSFPERLNFDTTCILDGFLSSSCDAECLVPIAELRATGIREAIYRRNDSHLAIGGNAYLTELILDRLGLPDFSHPTASSDLWSHVGDLGSKFPSPIVEALFVPNLAGGLFEQEKILKLREKMVAGHYGTVQVFSNPDAPIKRRLVCFGNSFANVTPGWGMSPFFVAIFSEFHFIWSPNVDMSYCAEVGADFVVAQTCERFLNRLPDDTVSWENAQWSPAA